MYVNRTFGIISPQTPTFRKTNIKPADSVGCQLLPRYKRRIHDPIDLRVVDSAFLFCSGVALIHVLMPIYSRHQNLRSSLLPSARQVALTPSSSEEGISWLHLMGELSPKVTEGEKPLDRCTNAVFLPGIYSSRSSAKPSSDQPARILRIPARRCRSFALQSLRCVNGQKNVA